MADPNVLITHKYGTASQWTSNSSYVLSLAEIGVESDTHKIKVGDGVTSWASLPYIGDQGSSPSNPSLNTYSSGIAITIDNSVSSYVNNILNITSTSGDITITVNESSYAVGTQMTFLRNTDQAIMFASGTATVYATPGLKMRARYSMATLLKVTDGSGSGDVWILTGDLTA